MRVAIIWITARLVIPNARPTKQGDTADQMIGSRLDPFLSAVTQGKKTQAEAEKGGECQCK